jgi:prevent-host-death family protein
MKRMPAGKFKTKCLAVMDEVQAKRESVIIAKHGKPVAKLVPVAAPDDDLCGLFQGKVRIVGDVVSPALTLDRMGRFSVILLDTHVVLW